MIRSGVLANGNVICHAGTSISIKPGFHAQAGSVFHAYIEEPVCTFAGGGPSAMALNNDNQTQQNQHLIEPELTELKEARVLDFKLVPNPNSGTFYIDLNGYNGQVFMEVLDLSGKIKYSALINSHEPLNLVLEKGVYVVRVLIDNHYLQQKLIIQ